MNSGGLIELDSMMEKDDEVSLRNLRNMKFQNEEDNDVLSTKSARPSNHYYNTS